MTVLELHETSTTIPVNVVKKSVASLEKDAKKMTEFHGAEVLQSASFVNKLLTKNTGMQEQAVKEYLEKFDNSSSAEERQSNYAQLVNNYYDLVTDFYEYGWGQSFHFCRFYKGESFDMAIARHEHYLAHKLNLKPGMKVLDVGCGVGGPMRQIARFSGATIIGINNNDYQVERIKVYNRATGLDKIATAVKGDFMNMPFEDNTFDAVYAIEATVHAPHLAGIMKEIKRVLKPGGVYASYEWLRTDEYDDNNPVHRECVAAIEEGDGISRMETVQECLADIAESGFELLEYEDLAPFDPRYEEPWYKTLEGSYSVSGFRMSRVGRFLTEAFVTVLEKFKIAPPGTTNVSQLLCKAADALVEGGKQKIFTPMFFYLVRKPLCELDGNADVKLDSNGDLIEEHPAH